MANKLIAVGNEFIRRDDIAWIRRLTHSLQQIDFSDQEATDSDIVALKNGRAYQRSTGTWYDWEIVVEPAPGSPTPPFKYDEARLLKEFSDYVASTYGKHYVGEDNVQSLDLIFATGHGKGFCIGNVIKYGARCGKKAGQERDDLLKTMHYAMLGLYQLDKDAKKNA